MKTPSMIRNALNKLRDNKKLETIVYAAMILAAVIIFLLTGGISCEGKDRTSEIVTPAETQKADTDHERELEARLEKILSEIEGAGKVSVMITTERTTGSDGTFYEQTVIKGVIVVAEGADNLKVKAELIDAVKTVLSVEPSIINVFH
ncbi:MAG: hypothetical protein J5854_01980 [Clostridia bacterium]|nr:hypothetical protein [Clostridia bacterium]